MDNETSASPARSSFALTTGVAALCFLVFAGIVLLSYVRYRDTSMTPDLSKVDAADQWKYTVEGRAQRLKEVRGREETAATTYGWVDQNAGVVRLPIARAMELVVAEQGRKN